MIGIGMAAGKIITGVPRIILDHFIEEGYPSFKFFIIRPACKIKVYTAGGYNKN
jgi:hypothetical protein